jgi:hypothetical protein
MDLLQDFEEVSKNLLQDFTGRKWLVETVRTWLSHPNPSPFLILMGAPGTGKSAFSAHLWRHEGIPHAVHFCIGGRGGTTDPLSFVGSIAEQLSLKLPEFGQALIDAQSAYPSFKITVNVHQQINTVTGGSIAGVSIQNLEISGMPPQTAFEWCIRQPLRTLAESGKLNQTVILIDALDEALTHTTDDNITDILSQAHDLPPQIRFLLTSRPDETLQTYFNDSRKILLDANGKDNGKDIHAYLSTRFESDEGLRTSLLQAGWNKQRFVTELGKASEGNFLYVIMVLYEIYAGRFPRPRGTLPRGLDAYYRYLLRTRVGLQQWKEWGVKLAEVLLAVQEPVSLEQMANYLGWEVRLTYSRLGALSQLLDPALRGHERYWRHHGSIVDFLSDRAKSGPFWSDIRQGHKRIAHFYIASSRWGGLAEGLPGLAKRENQRLHAEYPFHHLTTHLRLTENEALFTLVESRAWYDAQIGLDSSGASYHIDLARTWVAAETLDGKEIQDSRLAGRLGHEIRCALGIASLGSLSEGIPPALLKALVVCGKRPWTEALATARQTPSPSRRAEALCALVPLVPLELWHDIVLEGLSEAEKSEWPASRAAIRIALATHLPTAERRRIERETLDTILEIGREGMRADTLAWVAPVLPRHLLAKALRATRKIEDDYFQEKVLLALAPRLPKHLLAQALSFRPLQTMQCRPAMVTAQAAYVPEAERLPMLCQALVETRTLSDATWQAVAVRVLAPHLPGSMLQEALDIIRGLSPFRAPFRDEAIAAVATSLANMRDGAGALDAMQLMWDGFFQTRALATIAPHLSQLQREQAFGIAQQIKDPYWKAEGIGILVSFSPEHERSSIIQQALADLHIDDADDRRRALAVFAVYLPEVRKREAFTALQQIRDHYQRSEALVVLALHLPEDLLGEAFEVARRMDNDNTEARAMAALAPRLSSHLLEQELHTCGGLHPQAQKRVRLALAPYLPKPLLSQAFEAAQQLEDIRDQTTVRVALIPRLPETLLRKALDTAREIGAEDTEQRVRLLATIVPHLPPGERPAVLAEALEARQQVPEWKWNDEVSLALAVSLAIGARFEEALAQVERRWRHDSLWQESPWKVEALEQLIPLLPDSWLPRAHECAQRMHDWPGKLRVLAALNPRLPEEPFSEVVAPILNYDPEELASRVTSELVPLLKYLPDAHAQRPAVIGLALKATAAIPEIDSRSRALGALGPSLLAAKATLPLAEVYDLWRSILHKGAEGSRKELLAHLCNLAPVIAALGDTEAIEEAFRAIQEVGQWWP